jgi:streptogramin lyase
VQHKFFALSIAVMMFLGVCVGVAFADPSSEGESGSTLLPEISPQTLEEAQSLDAAPVVDPLAAEELPHSRLDRAEAEELLTSVFPASLEEPAGIFDGSLEIEEFHSDHVAVVAPPEPSAASGLLTSLLPLRTEDSAGVKEPVDLGLEKVKGELEPENPLVEVELPATLDEGISLPESGIGIELASGESERSASLISGEAAFYPNVATDTDLAAVPTPTGVETFTQLRSPQSPQTQTFRLNIPNGASFEATGEGGAQVKQGGETLMKVQPPTAIDAQGNPVPVDLSVSEDAIHLHLSPGPETAFPVLLDPVYESYSWMNSNSNTGIYTDWRATTSNEALLHPGWIGVWSETMHEGLNLRSYAGAIAPGSRANWFYYVPRYFSDFENPTVKERPTSYIRNMTLSQVYFLVEEGTPAHKEPYMGVGLWDENYNQWVSLGTHYSSEVAYSGVTINLPNDHEITDAKSGGYTLGTNESASYPRQAFVGQATVEVTDKDSPVFGFVESPSGWMNQTATGSIPYLVTDPGLGIYSLQVTQPKASGGSSQITTSNQCAGTASNTCPRTAETATRAITYEPKSMPQGEDWLKVTGNDPVGHQSTAGEARIKVDHTAPGLAISGNLTEQAKVGTKLPSYTLNYATTDGEDAAAAALTPYGATGTAEGQLERPQGIAIDGSGNIWVSDRVNNRITEYGPSGSFIRQINAHGSANGAISEPRGLAISPAGNIWVAENGNKRLQEFSPTGAFIAKITNLNFVEPWGVATGPGGTLWVSDPGAHKLFQFNESGTLAKTISGGGSNPPLTSPYGIAVDSSGNVWTADTSGNKILEFAPNGNFLFSFGTEGTGPGQLKAPTGLAITPSGHLFVSEDQNDRVQEFQPDGSYLRQFGTLGSASNQLTEPRQVAIGPENSLLIADAANHRIARWSHADRDPQSGVAKVEVKVDGAVAKNEAPGCSTKNCQINSSWTLNSDNYSVGSHKVEVTATDGVGLPSTKTLTVETHGDLVAPSIALSGSMTEQETLGTTRPTYKLKLSATDPGAAEERKSGVASTTIKVDGKVVDTTSPGCPSEGCSITREWTLESSAYSAGSHMVEAIATDAAGHTTTKTLSINITRDTTAPALSATGELYVAPEGWIEQKEYSAFATASDEGGYGVTSLELKIDGTVVKSSSGTCNAGGCSRFFFSGVNMSKYSGGAHPAELIATDAAGNKATKHWTINVDPERHISAAEAEDTLEALDDTSPVNTVGEAEAEADYEGTAEGLALEAAGETLVATGSAAPTIIDANEPGRFTVEVPSREEYVECPNGPGEEAEKERSGAEEEDLANSVNCIETHVLGPEEPLVAVEVVPTTEGSGTATLTPEGSAAVEANSGESVDLVTRPLFDGAMTFAAIRDSSGPETFSWTVRMDEEQELKQVDSQHAEVAYSDGEHIAFAITAVPAHDAIGTTVPTEISVKGDTLTLKVEHHGTSYVYPVVGGAGWEGGFQTSEIQMPTGVENEGAIEKEEFGDGTYSETAYGAPVLATSSGQSSDPPERERGYNFFRCTWHKKNAWEESGGAPSGPPPEEKEKIKHGCHGETDAGYVVTWALSNSGKYKYVRDQWAWASSPNCRHWGPDQPALIHHYSNPEEKKQNHAWTRYATIASRLDTIWVQTFALGKQCV